MRQEDEATQPGEPEQPEDDTAWTEASRAISLGQHLAIQVLKCGAIDPACGVEPTAKAEEVAF